MVWNGSADKIFFSNDQPIYVSGSRGPVDDIFGENLSPRGWEGDLMACIEVEEKTTTLGINFDARKCQTPDVKIDC